MIRPFALTAALMSSSAFAGNYANCIIDGAQGVQNDAAAHAIRQVCLSKHPGGLAEIPQGDGRGWFSYGSGAECTAEKAAKTPSRVAGQLIHYACRRLYDKAPYKVIEVSPSINLDPVK